MSARRISPLDRDSYQRAARLILSHHLVTTRYPDRAALPLLRRWATELREDLLELFGYRLEVTETTARLFTVADRLDPGGGARSVTDRPFDRRRYAYLALALAALGRAGGQITLSELAEQVASEAGQVPGVELAPERATDRDAFVDAVAWLAARGAIALADGDAGGWVSDPERGEALYDIDGDRRDGDRSVGTAEVARRVRRALVQRPVVYAEELDDEARLQLALPRTTAGIELLTGLVAERRAEGVALVDSSGRMSDLRFPGVGTVPQVALLLAGEICARVSEPGCEPVRLPRPVDAEAELEAGLDAAIPAAGVFAPLAGDAAAADAPPGSRPAPAHPLVEDSWLAETVARLADEFGRTFAAQWQADPAGLLEAAVTVLERQRLVARVPGGVLALPALARFRGVVVTVRERDPRLALAGEDSNEAEMS
ncbi:MAG: TIGR02678 family protein [Acidobacteria bacterium]|nr:MAG: TIGR02678 family protein [Acidobacteriota bacterium]